eukprot:533554-Amphidinium_carterae.2
MLMLQAEAEVVEVSAAAAVDLLDVWSRWTALQSPLKRWIGHRPRAARMVRTLVVGAWLVPALSSALVLDEMEMSPSS